MPKRPEGLPAYGWESLLRLADMATKAMLRLDRREPGPDQKPVGCYWSGHDWVLLWKASQAVAMPPMSPGRQRLYDQNRTCAECGKKSKMPWEKGLDGRRYCYDCQDPVHERLWRQERERDRPAITAWARGVLADESVVLACARSHQWYREVHAVDLTGVVVLDARIRYSANPDPDFMARHPENFEGTVSPVDHAARVGDLVGSRIVAWWPSSDLSTLAVSFDEDGKGARGLATAAGDYLGTWYDRWVGEFAGGSYRYHPRLRTQPQPWEPVEQVIRMREVLTEMAQGPDAGASP